MSESIEIIRSFDDTLNSGITNSYYDVENEKKKVLLCKIFKTTTDKIPLTIILCLVFLNFGICGSILGPAMIDLACQTRSSLTEVSWLLFIQNLTALVGCIGSGLLIRHHIISPNNLLIICSGLLPIFVSLIPFPSRLYLLGIIMSLVGLNMGCIDNIGNLSIIKLHGLNVSPFIQVFRTFF